MARHVDVGGPDYWRVADLDPIWSMKRWVVCKRAVESDRLGVVAGSAEDLPIVASVGSAGGEGDNVVELDRLG
jgi:hypothetical protein